MIIAEFSGIVLGRKVEPKMTRKPVLPRIGVWLIIGSLLCLISYVLFLFFSSLENIPAIIRFTLTGTIGGSIIILLYLLIERVRKRKDEEDDLNKY